MTDGKNAAQIAVAQYFMGFIRWASMSAHLLASLYAGYWGFVNAPELWVSLGFDTLSMWLRSSAPFLYAWLGLAWSAGIAFILFSIVIYPTAMLHGDRHNGK